MPDDLWDLRAAVITWRPGSLWTCAFDCCPEGRPLATYVADIHCAEPGCPRALVGVPMCTSCVALLRAGKINVDEGHGVPVVDRISSYDARALIPGSTGG